MADRQRRYVISGRVQGVWYRVHTRDKAVELGLRGWVRNRPDGSVEALAQGPAETLDRLEAWLRVGPPLAVVREVAITEETPGPTLPDFDIRG